jgi:hypothetical protein
VQLQVRPQAIRTNQYAAADMVVSKKVVVRSNLVDGSERASSNLFFESKDLVDIVIVEEIIQVVGDRHPGTLAEERMQTTTTITA